MSSWERATVGEFVGRGVGSSKKTAEQASAEDALEAAAALAAVRPDPATAVELVRRRAGSLTVTDDLTVIAIRRDAP